MLNMTLRKVSLFTLLATAALAIAPLTNAAAQTDTLTLNGTVKIVQADQIAPNGVIQIVDGVLVAPPPSTAAATASRPSSSSSTTSALWRWWWAKMAMLCSALATTPGASREIQTVLMLLAAQ